MTDLPPGPWTALLIGHQWPSVAAVDAMATGSARRKSLAASLDAYGDELRAISQTYLCAQQGVTADDIGAAFQRGEVHSRTLAARNLAKSDALHRARVVVAELRCTLSEIAEHGNRRINAILDSKAPAAEKVAHIVDVVSTAQRQATEKAALHGGDIAGSIQSVLDESGLDVSARHFADGHGVDIPNLHRPPDHDIIGEQVRRMLDRTPAHSTDPAPGSGPAASVAPAGPADPSGAMPADQFAAGVQAAAPLAAAIAAGAHGVPDRTAAPQEHASPSPTSPSPATPAPPAPAQSGVGHARTGPATGSVAPPSTSPVPLQRYGADLRPPIRPVSPMAPLAAGVHPPATVTGSHTGTHAVTAVGLARRRAVPAVDEQSRLRRLLHAIARQAPGFAWAVAEYADGSTLAMTDLAGGWIPPGIAIPVGLAVPAPRSDHSDMTALVGTPTAAVYSAPGQRIPEPDGEADVPATTPAQDATAVEDFWWALSQATRWRDGLPRVAHTLARATIRGTGHLDSEVDLLRTHLRVTAERAVSGYPGAIDRDGILDWQLLAAVAALVDGETGNAAYHFAWFTTQSGVRRQ